LSSGEREIIVDLARWITENSKEPNASTRAEKGGKVNGLTMSFLTKFGFQT
jgi:hypothetical protein